MQDNVGWLQLFVGQAHSAEGLIVENVDATSAVHMDLVQGVPIYLGCYH